MPLSWRDAPPAKKRNKKVSGDKKAILERRLARIRKALRRHLEKHGLGEAALRSRYLKKFQDGKGPRILKRKNFSRQINEICGMAGKENKNRHTRDVYIERGAKSGKVIHAGFIREFKNDLFWVVHVRVKWDRRKRKFRIDPSKLKLRF